MPGMGIGWIGAAWKSALIVWRTFWKAARQLFHEFMGTLFALFAVSGAIALWRHWHSARVPWIVAATIVYILMMAAFSWWSFRDARRVR